MVYSIVDKLLWVEEISCFHMGMVNIRDIWHHFFSSELFIEAFCTYFKRNVG